MCNVVTHNRLHTRFNLVICSLANVNPRHATVPQELRVQLVAQAHRQTLGCKSGDGLLFALKLKLLTYSFILKTKQTKKNPQIYLMWSVKWTFPEKRSKSSLFFLQKIKCHLYSLGNNSLEINIHSQKIVQRPRGVQFPPPCDRWNPLFPCHNQGHYYLITEMSDSPSGRLNSFFPLHIHFSAPETRNHWCQRLAICSAWHRVSKKEKK